MQMSLLQIYLSFAEWTAVDIFGVGQCFCKEASIINNTMFGNYNVYIFQVIIIYWRQQLLFSHYKNYTFF